MEIHLFRHGETNWNVEKRAQSHNGSELTDTGIDKARQVATKIAHINYDMIFCSSSLRAKQTAWQFWPNQIDQIVYSDELKEISLGPWEGKLYKDIKISEPTSHYNFFHRPDLFNVRGAETFDQLTIRSLKAIQKIAHENSKKCIAVVTHGAFIKALLTKIEGKQLSQIWEPPLMQNCAHNIISFDKSFQATIKQYADINDWQKNQP